jgi:hypothetical protein
MQVHSRERFRRLIQSGTYKIGRPSDLSTICQERALLLRNYADAVGSYAKSVREMADLVMSGEEVRANEVRRNCRIGWEETERSRLALYRHEADHSCARAANVPNIS